MLPIRHSSIFKSRWMALLWAAGFIWLAIEVAGPDDPANNSAANVTDVTGAPVTPADEKALEDALKDL